MEGYIVLVLKKKGKIVKEEQFTLDAMQTELYNRVPDRKWDIWDLLFRSKTIKAWYLKKINSAFNEIIISDGFGTYPTNSDQ